MSTVSGGVGLLSRASACLASAMDLAPSAKAFGPVNGNKGLAPLNHIQPVICDTHTNSSAWSTAVTATIVSVNATNKLATGVRFTP